MPYLNLDQFINPKTINKYHFGVGIADHAIKGLEDLISRLKDGRISCIQEVELSRKAVLENFSMTRLTFVFAEKDDGD